MSENPMSEKQLNFAVNLVIERAGLLGIDPTPTSASEFIFAKQANYTSADASQLINMLLAVVVEKPADPIQELSLKNAGVVNPKRIITNKFAKACLACGHDVENGSGYACQLSNDKWVTIHKDGNCVEPVKDGSHLHNRIEQVVTACVASMPHLISEGCEYYFAIASHTGNNDLDFYALVTSHRKAGDTWVLKRVVGGSLSGSDLTANSPVMSLVEAKRVIDWLATRTEHEFATAQMSFASSLGRCFCCGRTLTDDHSREVGMGSVCEAKYGGGAGDQLDLF
jgi:hypothetical protein